MLECDSCGRPGEHKFIEGARICKWCELIAMQDKLISLQADVIALDTKLEKSLRSEIRFLGALLLLSGVSGIVFLLMLWWR